MRCRCASSSSGSSVTPPTCQVRPDTPPPRAPATSRRARSPISASPIVTLYSRFHASNPGALFTDLAPTAIALASYFCLADIILITQCSYYNAKNARSSRRRSRRRASREDSVTSPSATEHSPLLDRQGEEPNKAASGGEAADNRPWLVNTLALLAVWIVGGLGWFVSYKFGAWDVETPGASQPPENPTHKIGAVLGYISAVFYLL